MLMAPILDSAQKRRDTELQNARQITTAVWRLGGRGSAESEEFPGISGVAFRMRCRRGCCCSIIAMSYGASASCLLRFCELPLLACHKYFLASSFFFFVFLNFIFGSFVKWGQQSCESKVQDVGDAVQFNAAKPVLKLSHQLTTISFA